MNSKIGMPGRAGIPTPALPAVCLAVAVAACDGGTTQDFLPDTSLDGVLDTGGDASTETGDTPTETGDCTPPETMCGGVCTDTASDPLNCGSCDNVCPGAENADPVCYMSTCYTQCHEGYMDLDGDGSCEYACVATGAETCNGVDDDCNGTVDDGYPCAMGDTVPCTTTCGSTGEGTCAADCTLPSSDACLPPPETCNGADDDCDTLADNGFDCPAGTIVDCTTECGTTGQGTCNADCTLPTESQCSAGVEVCNGIDDNCNGTADEGYLCAAGSTVSCTTTCGSAGSGTCTASCTPPATGACAPPPETCNAIDDDCDTINDNGFDCVMGAPVACTTTCGSTGTGTCSSSCVAPDPAACTVPSESCNGADDDCDTVPDDGFACVLGTTGLACTTGGGTAGTADCTSSCTLGTCCAATDTCGNGWDDDCDTVPDDGCCTDNDTCVCATPISVPGTSSGSTASMTNDYTASCAGGAGSPDVVYTFTLTSTRTVTISTDGSGYDTALYLHSGSCPGTEVDCDDDGGSGLQSMITITLSAGTYWIFVDGYSSYNSGSYSLSIN